MRRWRFASLRHHLTLSHTLVALSLGVGMSVLTLGMTLRQARSLESTFLTRAENLASQKILAQIRQLEETRDGLAQELLSRPLAKAEIKDLLFLHRVLFFSDMDRVEVFNNSQLLIEAYPPVFGENPELATNWYPKNPQVAALLFAGRGVTWLQVGDSGVASLKSAVRVSPAADPESLFLVVTLGLHPSLLAGTLPPATHGLLLSGERVLGSWPPGGFQETNRPRLGIPAAKRAVAHFDDDSTLELQILAEGKGIFAALGPVLRGGLLVTLVSLVLALLLGETLARRILAPLNDLLEGTAAMARGHLSVRLPVRSDDELGALTKEFNRMTDELRTTYLGVIATLAEVVEAKSSYTREHIERVERLCMATAQILEERGWAKWSSHQRFILSVAAILHDVGKIAISSDILNKPGPLTGNERSEILSHPEVGAKIVERMGKLDRAAEIIRASHEHYDGTGYPRGLKGQEIPLEARIILAVDAFDAMTQLRPYSKSRSFEDVFAEMQAEAGKQFDPVVVEALIEAVRRDLKGETSPSASSSGFYKMLKDASGDAILTTN